MYKFKKHILNYYKHFKKAEAPLLPVGHLALTNLSVIISSYLSGTDYLLCDGRELKRKDYPELFNLFGTTYGKGDGVTTFNLPKLIRGVDIGLIKYK